MQYSRREKLCSVVLFPVAVKGDVESLLQGKGGLANALQHGPKPAEAVTSLADLTLLLVQHCLKTFLLLVQPAGGGGGGG